MGHISFYSNQSMIHYMLRKMDPKIKKTLQSIPISCKDDIEQELKLKMIQAIERICQEECPGYFDFKEKVEEESQIAK